MRILRDYCMPIVAVFSLALFCTNILPKARRAIPAQPAIAAPVYRQPAGIQPMQPRPIAAPAPRQPGPSAVARPIAVPAPRQPAPSTRVQPIAWPARQLTKSHTKFTQTEAYFEVPKLRDLVTKTFYGDFEPVKHMDIVSRVMAREAEFRDTHWAFYHGLTNDWTVWQDAYKELFNHFNPSLAKEGEDDFIFLRIKGAQFATAHDFLVNSLKKFGLVDDTGKVKAILLSANNFLFGNTALSGESTWMYAMTDKSHAEPDRQNYIDMMDEFGLSHQYIDELMSLTKLVEITKQQTLLQILVPKNTVDEVGYLAWTKGIPAHEGSISWVKKSHVRSTGGSRAVAALDVLKNTFKKEQERNPLFKEMLADIEEGAYSLDDFLTKCCNEPLAVPYMDGVQARLLFTDDVLLNPASGVKMYRYTGVPYRQMQEYKQRLDAVIKNIIATKR